MNNIFQIYIHVVMVGTNDNSYEAFNDVKEWTNTLISRHGFMVIAHAENNKASVKQYKSALIKVQKLLYHRYRQTTDRTLKADYKELHHKIKILNNHARQELV